MLGEILVIVFLGGWALIAYGLQLIGVGEVLSYILGFIIILILFLLPMIISQGIAGGSNSSSTNTPTRTPSNNNNNQYDWYKDDNNVYRWKLSPSEISRMRDAKYKGIDFGAAYSAATSWRTRSEEEQRLYKNKLSPEEEARYRDAQDQWKKL